MKLIFIHFSPLKSFAKFAAAFMTKIIICTLCFVTLFSCYSDDKDESAATGPEITLNKKFGALKEGKKYELNNFDSRVKVEILKIDGGIHCKTKKKGTFLGKKSFDFYWVKNESKKYLMERLKWLQNTLKAQKLIGFTSQFYQIGFNDTLVNVYWQEGIGKQVVESSKNREGILFTVEGSEVTIEFAPKRTSVEKRIQLKELIGNYLKGDVSTQCFFDWDKSIKIFSTIQAIGLRGENDIKMCYYFNPVSSLVEPIPFYAPNKKVDDLRIKLSGDKSFNYSLSFNKSQVLKADHIIKNGVYSISGKLKVFEAQKYITDTMSCYTTENFDKYFELEEGVYKLKQNKVEINKNVVSPKGIKIELKDGQEINFTNGGFILSFSPIKVIGVKFYSSDSTGRGLHVINARGESLIANSSFDGLKNLAFDSWKLPSAVTFYESPIKITNTQFLNNQSEDGLNLFRCDSFVVEGCTFKNTFSDAFDADFSDGVLSKCDFLNLGNDGIDFSGSALKIIGCSFKNVADKALSAGEGSTMKVDSVNIEGASLAITAKDNSSIDITNSIISNSEVVFCAFQKKKEFGPSNIIGNNIVLKNTKKEFLIEKKSSLTLDGKAVEKYEESVRDILYGNEYGKATVK